MSLVFLAISRTGNDPLRHDLFEVAAVHRFEVDGALAERAVYYAIKPERLAGADPDELLRTSFYDRSAAWGHNGASVVSIDPNLGTTTPSTHGGVARHLAKMLLGAQLVTLGLDREAEFVGEFLRSQREPAGWVGHLDVTSASAGGIAGYSQGWAARGRREVATTVPSSIDLAAALMPLDPFRIASAIGAKLVGEPVSALTRAYLARDMWAIVTAPLAAEVEASWTGVHIVPSSAEASAVTVAMPAQGAAAVGPPTDGRDGPNTGDVALDRVITGLSEPLDDPRF